jgi:superfamily I DNA and/or RNA helicase
MATSSQLANRMLQYMQSSSSKVNIFRAFNASQLRALEAAWTRRLTLIQGPPGSGKTAVAAAAAFGFAYQCRNAISKKSAKVLATAFSNTGADNLARAMIEVGLRVIRIGKPSAVDQLLWEHTLEAAIDRDPAAQKALQAAAKATAQLSKLNQRNDNSNRASGKATTTNIRDRAIRDAATDAVKAAIEAANLAATKALRETDVIVSTSTGAADPRLLRACGIKSAEDPNDDEKEQNTKTKSGMNDRVMAPDGLPPLSLPFVIIDEACQSVEPATLIPILASNSCRSLVLLGDPCQLPPTVLSRQASKELSVSLMERLAEILPQPVTSNQNDSVVKIDESYLGALPMKQAISLLRSRSSSTEKHRTYRKTYGGSILLSTQYRMHPSIAAFSSAIFYDGLLSTPDFMTHRRLFPNALQRSMPHEDPKLCVRFVDIGGQENERQGMPSSKYTPSAYNSKSSTSSFLFQQQQQSTSFWNEVEAAKVIEIVKDVLSDEDDNVKSIGIISPYNGQVQLIQLLIANDDQLKDLLSQRKTSFSDISIEVNSVDGYQGRERDMVIFSAVRSNRRGQIGFLRDWRRLNVAITRAKSALVIVGDVATLTAANDPYWEALVKWASGSRCIVTADDKKQ